MVIGKEERRIEAAELERFTLRLPERVRREMISADEESTVARRDGVDRAVGQVAYVHRQDFLLQ